jgi:hypothetical protein
MTNSRNSDALRRFRAMSLNDICSFVEDVHILTSNKGFLFRGPSNTLPLNGLYVFFEVGQKIVINSKEYNRIVRIGINEKPNNFRSRIRGHYNGNIEGSVFRENVGWALLESYGKKPLQSYRTKKNYRKQNSGGALEREISNYFARSLSFKAFKIDYGKLAMYEKTLIAAFSLYYQYKTFQKELDLRNWLGLHSYSKQERIKRSGLWNSEGVFLIEEPFSLDRMEIDRQILSLPKLNAVLADLTQNIVT